MVFHVEVDFSSFQIVAGLGQESGDQAQEGFFIGDDRTHLSGPLRVLVCELGMDTIAPQTPLGLGSPVGCAVSPDSISAGNRPPPPALPSASTVVLGSSIHPGNVRENSPKTRSAADSCSVMRPAHDW